MGKGAGSERAAGRRGFRLVFAVLGPLVWATLAWGCALFPSLDTLGSGVADGSDLDRLLSGDQRSHSDASDGKAPPGDANTMDVNQGDEDGQHGDDGGGDVGLGDAPEDVPNVAIGGGFGCGSGAVHHCSDCTGYPMPCVVCETDGAVGGFCAELGASCHDLDPPGFKSCACGGEAGVEDCPDPFQICSGGHFCHSCGEPSSNGNVCLSGGTCNASTGDCM
jgi:hypothetical protein